jgi:chromosomal replication initiator protein
VSRTKIKDARSAAILEGIAERITTQQFETWFRLLHLVFVPPDEVRITVPNRFHQIWIERRYQDVIAETVRQLAHTTPRLTVTVDPSLRTDPLAEDEGDDEREDVLFSPRTEAQRPEIPGQPLNPDYTFENFVVGPSNHFCHAATKAVAEHPGDTYNPLFIHGNAGLGKTHLLQALGHTLHQKEFRVCYTSCEDFTNHFISAIETRSLDSFRWRYRHVDALAVDDVHFLADKEKTQEEFFHTFNTLYNQQKQIILSSDRHPKDIPDIEERLVSRFKWGLVIQLEPPPLETRIAIVRRKARLRGMELTDLAATFIGERIKENVRELEGAVNRVIYLSRLSNREVDTDLLREALTDLVPALPARSGPGLADILRVVANRFGLRPTDIQSRRQTKSVAFPRQICMYLARLCTQCSLEEIGGHFGGRDHTTVHYGIRKIEGMVKKDQETKLLVESIMGSLKA